MEDKKKTVVIMSVTMIFSTQKKREFDLRNYLNVLYSTEQEG